MNRATDFACRADVRVSDARLERLLRRPAAAFRVNLPALYAAAGAGARNARQTGADRAAALQLAAARAAAEEETQ